MFWILWFQLTTVAVCSPEIVCPGPTIHTQPLPGTFQTQAACEYVLQQRQHTKAGQRGETVGNGMRVTTTTKLWCAQAEGK
jgi:hypothetical protein